MQIDDDCFFIEIHWEPKSGTEVDGLRTIAVRTRRAVRRKGPLQLDLEPRDHEY